MRCTVIMAVPDGASALAVVVQLDHLGRLEERRRQLGEAHHQHGPDGEVRAPPGSCSSVKAVASSSRSSAVRPVVPMTAWTPWCGAPRGVGAGGARDGEVDGDLGAGLGQRVRPGGDRDALDDLAGAAPDRRRPPARARGRRRPRCTPSRPCGRRHRTPPRGSSQAERSNPTGDDLGWFCGRRRRRLAAWPASGVPGSPDALRHQHPERRSGRRPARAGPGDRGRGLGRAVRLGPPPPRPPAAVPGPRPVGAARRDGALHPPHPPRPPRHARGPPPAVGAGQAGRHPRPPHRGAGRARRRPRSPGRPTSSAPSATRPTTASGPTSSTRACRVITALWTGDPVDYDGDHFRVERAVPARPVQQPRPPIWVAGMWPNRRPLERAARYDGVVPLARRRRADDARRAGRGAWPSPAGARASTWWPRPRPACRLQEYADAGATWLVQSFWPRDGYLNELRNIARRTGPA